MHTAIASSAAQKEKEIHTRLITIRGRGRSWKRGSVDFARGGAAQRSLLADKGGLRPLKKQFSQLQDFKVPQESESLSITVALTALSASPTDLR